MKIIRVTVKSLFGVFDHDIPLNSESGITIVIGENGLGKTVILESISALFSKNYDFFRTLVFENFMFYFDNNDTWQLTKKNDENGFSLYILKDSIIKPVSKGKTQKIYQDTERYNRRIMMRERDINRRIDMEIDKSYWVEQDRGYFNRLELEKEYEYLRLMELKHHRRMMMINNESETTPPPKWFTDGLDKINVKLIETQRIITAKEIGSDSYINNLKKCSEELKEMIAVSIKKSSFVASELDSTYPNRLVLKLRQGTRDTFEELNLALAKLDEKRKSFSSTGLVVKISDSDLLQIDEGQKDLINVLKLYIDDSHKKLEPFEDLSRKIKLFKGLINKRFKHKKLEIKQDEGLVFYSTVVKNSKGDYESIPPSRLSSGEQNELILFYKLIFNSYSNDMVLIDEPELSLHISWQNKFIKDLKEVTSINGVSIVIATHSPDIIDENWDLKVELLGVE
ncbi:AAA family ATPase [Aeromonas salmonicida]|uniref:ATP-binding protein involved in virulence n=1 Tax=Aeromonas salmonicida TaxID=645 RepID=A0AAX1PPC6_AERSA|nr:AAA family ATPase [Aeromonas salmonicida]RAJ09887.1 putative ATP-binding protein involved in virulence [Aeromonas salmonicida]